MLGVDHLQNPKPLPYKISYRIPTRTQIEPRVEPSFGALRFRPLGFGEFRLLGISSLRVGFRVWGLGFRV